MEMFRWNMSETESIWPQKTCVKKPYSAAQAEREVAQLKRDAPEARWNYEWCDECEIFHIVRS